MTASLWLGVHDRAVVRVDVYVGNATRVSNNDPFPPVFFLLTYAKKERLIIPTDVPEQCFLHRLHKVSDDVFSPSPRPMVH